MTCDVPCCAYRFPMYLSLYPYQGLIEFCADLDQYFARIMYTHHLDCFAEAGRLSSRIEQIEMTPKLGTQIYNWLIDYTVSRPLTLVMSLLSAPIPSSSWCWASFLDGPEGPSFDSGLSSDWTRGTDGLGSPVVGQGPRGRQFTGPPLTRVSHVITFNDEDGRYIYDAALLHEILEENEICLESARRFEILMMIWRLQVATARV